MGSSELNPLDELRGLGQQIDQATELASLKPLFQRLDELARVHSGDLDVQLTVTALKDRVIRKGVELREQAPVVPAPVMPAPAAPPAALPETRTVTVTVPPPSSPAPPKPASAAPPPPPTARKKTLRGPLVTWAIVGAILGVLVFAIAYNKNKERQRDAVAPVAVKIVTTPPGATVLRDGQTLCTSECEVQMVPGSYAFAVQMEGYETALRDATVLSGQPLALEFALTPQKAVVRIYADLAQGQVTLDGQPAGTLEGGQLMLDSVEPGSHTLEVAGGGSSAAFTFEMKSGAPPDVSGDMKTKDLLAVAVTSMGRQGRVVTSAGPLKLAMNGKVQADAGPAGVDLAEFQPGVAELVVGQGSAARTMQETFTAAPALTVFLKSDQNIGTLVVAAGQDEARVFLDGKEQPKRTQRGQLRIATLGKVTVRVQKNGYEDPEPKTVTVAKGAEVRVAFTMRQLPEFSVLEVSDGTPGAEVWVDQRQIGAVGADGRFRNNSIDPGNRAIELRRDQYEPKRFQRNFPAGRTVAISGADATLVAIRVAPPPPPPETPKPEPPAPPPPKIVAAPKPQSGTMAQFDNASLWREQDGVFRRKGPGTFTYGPTPNGVFTFTIHLIKGGGIFRGGRVRWVAQYVNARNYLVYEMDNENLWAKVVEEGKTFERRRVAHGVNKDLRNWTLQVDLSPTQAAIRIERAGQWVTLDTFTEPGRDFTKGKFGILVTGDDEVGLSDFRFVGR